MLREGLVLELQHLEDEIVELGSVVEGALVDSVWQLCQRDVEGARRLIARDQEVNRKRFIIEDAALTLIATQQPMAGDLRTVAAVLEIVTELERIGDYAKGNAKVSLLIGDETLIMPLIEFPPMAERTVDMLHRALEAFVRRDAVQAQNISEMDDVVDDLYNRIYRSLVTSVVANPHDVDQANYLMWVAHNLERAADRVVNICERVVFTVSGVMAEMDSGRYYPD